MQNIQNNKVEVQRFCRPTYVFISCSIPPLDIITSSVRKFQLFTLYRRPCRPFSSRLQQHASILILENTQNSQRSNRISMLCVCCSFAPFMKCESLLSSSLFWENRFYVAKRFQMTTRGGERQIGAGKADWSEAEYEKTENMNANRNRSRKNKSSPADPSFTQSW